MKIAVITPYPPQHSGIADYAKDLVGGLEELGVSVSVFSNANAPTSAKECLEFIPDRSYSSVVYQVGNNEKFHGYMIEMIKKYPGIVHLHDMVIHAMVFDTYRKKGDIVEYLNGLYNYYGIEGARGIIKSIQEKNPIWNSPDAAVAPMFEVALRHAKGCIVHSEFSKNKIKEKFPFLPIFVVPQSYRIEFRGPKKADGDVLKIGILGGVDPYKRVDVAIKAVADAVKKGGCNIELTVAGGINTKCEYILDMPSQLGIKCDFRGRVDDSEFVGIIDSSDIIISLRHPTMGETSAVVTKALMRGVAVIVNNSGWYAELPNKIPKLGIERTQEELTELLLSLSQNRSKIDEIALSGYEYAKKNLEYKAVLRRYIEVLDEIERRGGRFAKTVASKVANDGLTETALSRIKEFGND